VNPVSSRNGRNVGPYRTRLRNVHERLPEICRHLGFRLLSRQCDLQRYEIAYSCTRSFTQPTPHFEPVPLSAVRLERRSKGKAINCAFNRRHAPRGKLCAGGLWQRKKGPRAALRCCSGPQEFRFEPNPTSALSHLCMIYRSRIRAMGPIACRERPRLTDPLRSLRYLKSGRSTLRKRTAPMQSGCYFRGIRTSPSPIRSTH
jgi:hypothetical protein